MTTRSFLERYADGQCEQVWDELYALDSAVRRLDVVEGTGPGTRREHALACLTRDLLPI